MKKDRIVKMAMSAAAAAYVAVMPVQAEENGEEVIIRQWDEAHEAPGPNGYGQAAEENGSNGDAIDENTESTNTADGDMAASGESGEGGSREEIQKADEADTIEETSQAGEAVALPAEDGQTAGGQGPKRVCLRSAGSGAGDGAPCLSGDTPALMEGGGAAEAEYSAMGRGSDGDIGEISVEKADMEEIIRKTGYGPHLILYQKQQVEQGQAEPEPETAPSYSEEDLYVLAHAICGEGQGYPDDEQLYIGSVILNRRAHGAFPDTIKGVVFQRGQYACTRDGNYYREPTEANWRNARWLLENGSVLPGDVVYQAGFRQGSGLYVQTRYHKYCYR